MKSKFSIRSILTVCRVSFVFAAMLMSVLNWGCSLPGETRAERLVIASYNVQTLFNAELDGYEFSEYRPDPDAWNSKKYHNRLRNLSRVLREIHPGGPDVVLLQEVENISIVEDLIRYYMADCEYAYAEASNQSHAALNIAVLSKYPLKRARAHSVSYNGVNLRPVIHIELQPGIHQPIHILAVHWKSKLQNGGPPTELLRRAQARSCNLIMGEIISNNPDAYIILAGDTNEDIHEFRRNGEAAVTALMPLSSRDSGLFSETPRQNSLWVQSVEELNPDLISEFAVEYGYMPLVHYWEGKDGSFFYGDEWEKIDQMLLSASILNDPEIGEIHFDVCTSSFLLNTRGEPRAYIARYGTGYSDHLPLRLELVFQ